MPAPAVRGFPTLAHAQETFINIRAKLAITGQAIVSSVDVGLVRFCTASILATAILAKALVVIFA